MTTATFTKSITPQFETVGSRQKLVGQLGEIRDESGLLIHSQSYDSKIEAEMALDDLVYELLVDYAERGLVDALPAPVSGKTFVEHDFEAIRTAEFLEDEQDYIAQKPANRHRFDTATCAPVEMSDRDTAYTHRRSEYTYDVFVEGCWMASAKNQHHADIAADEAQHRGHLDVVRCHTCGGEGDCPDCDPDAHFGALELAEAQRLDELEAERDAIEADGDSYGAFESSVAEATAWQSTPEPSSPLTTAQTLAQSLANITRVPTHVVAQNGAYLVQDETDIDCYGGRAAIVATYAPLAQTRQSQAIEQTQRRCHNCGADHRTWQCPEIASALFRPAATRAGKMSRWGASCAGCAGATSVPSWRCY
jgi:hypothetical protein